MYLFGSGGSIYFSTPIPKGKHLMLSYNSKNHDIVSKIYQTLQNQNIPVWFDEDGDMKTNMYESLANGIENATAVCCFLTPDYEKSEVCKLELQYAHKRCKRIIPCMLSHADHWNPTDWLALITRELVYIDFQNICESIIDIKTRELIDRIQEHTTVLRYPQIQPIRESNYLFELIRHQYIQNSRIERFMNPAKSFPIKESYINLAIVENKEQQEKEKKLRDISHNDTIINTYEEIYGTKTPIDIKHIFQKCKHPSRHILVFGRAGIGKSTFCRYAAHQWAAGVIWPEYDLVILFPLRSLTQTRYPLLSPRDSYSLTDIVEKEYFSYGLSETEKNLLRNKLNKSKILWLLDGYDEIVQSVPSHLEYLFEQLWKTPHHIVTSRPYFNTLSYTVQMEITGFTDNNIPNYVKQFFREIMDELKDAPVEGEKLLDIIKSNPSVWGVAHIPINLEMICSLWSDKDPSSTKALTLTALYDEIIQWLCRRYLTKQQNKN